MSLRSARTHRQVGLALVVGVAVCLLLPAAPALADPPHPPATNVPPGAGWSANWHYEDPTDAAGTLVYSMRIPQASLDGTAWDTDTTRDLGFALTDLSATGRRLIYNLRLIMNIMESCGMGAASIHMAVWP